MKKSSGFSLIEIMVVIVLVSILGLILSTLLSRTLRGNNKTVLISNIKQDGQNALNIIGGTIRSSDAIVCLGNYNTSFSSTGPYDTIAVVQQGSYYRFRMYVPNPSGPTNGYIAQDSPIVGPSGIDPNNTGYLCVAQGDTHNIAPTNQVLLTNQNVTNGTSLIIISSTGFTQNASLTTKGVVTINFNLGPAVKGALGADTTLTSTGVSFLTTVELR